MDELLLNYLEEQDVTGHMGFRIMLVDDEEDNLYLLQSFLEDSYEISTATSGEEALELLENQGVDLFIVDQKMDGMDGLTFCEMASQRCPNSIRIMLTAFSDREMLLAAIQTGKIFRVMTKPFNIVELESAIEEAFRKLAYQRAFANLIEELQQKNKELEDSYEQLRLEQEARLRSERLATIGQVTSRIAHEMNNQLSIFAMLKANRTALRQVPSVANSIDFVLEATENLVEMVRLIQDYTRGQTPKQQITEINLSSFVHDTVRFVQQTPIAEHTTFEESYDEVPPCRLDRSQIKQVLLNLLRNAIQAMEVDPKVWVRVTQPSTAWVEIAIQDQGKGIPESIAPKIFEPFFTTKSHQGLGLGLEVCKRIVEQHGGSISFQSVEDQGTTFTIALPVKREHIDGESVQG
ncbi:MAG: hybrid sensor histidine kinase/response regulator [Deltaproteobacteria bacterium]|nr:MAG: hybrid sensor histidine kinase/response regulator [Deltaproteobacteria bacterium]